jgi:hypothetical protein
MLIRRTIPQSHANLKNPPAIQLDLSDGSQYTPRTSMRIDLFQAVFSGKAEDPHNARPE